jgi:hypothetical protein
MLAVHQLAQMFPHQCTTSPQGAHGQTCASVANLKPAPQSALSAAMDDLVTRRVSLSEAAVFHGLVFFATCAALALSNMHCAWNEQLRLVE